MFREKVQHIPDGDKVNISQKPTDFHHYGLLITSSDKQSNSQIATTKQRTTICGQCS